MRTVALAAAATVLMTVSSPILAKDYVPCAGLDATVIAKNINTIWQQHATPERPAAAILDVIPPIESRRSETPNDCMIYLMTSEGDIAYNFDAFVVNGKSYVETQPNGNMRWDSFLQFRELAENARKAAEEAARHPAPSRSPTINPDSATTRPGFTTCYAPPGTMTSFGPSGPVPEGARICDLPAGAKPNATFGQPSKPPPKPQLSPDEEVALRTAAVRGDNVAKQRLLDAGKCVPNFNCPGTPPPASNIATKALSPTERAHSAMQLRRSTMNVANVGYVVFDAMIILIYFAPTLVAMRRSMVAHPGECEADAHLPAPSRD